MADDVTIDVEIADDHDVENVAAEVYTNLQLVADDIQQGLLDEATGSLDDAKVGIAAIEQYLADKINQKGKQ